jgi:hypothetical protein
MTVVALATMCAACVGTGEPPDLEGSGPADIREEIVRRHAREFSTELADRDPGSQGEQAASFYILGHLQQAGYVVRLDAVPVGNLVNSTNLVGLPPGGDDPEVVVPVSYDTGGDLALAVFLELARALHVADPEHSVEFVALGAEGTRGDDALLGSRRLTRVLLDEEVNPVIVTLDITQAGDGGVFVDGDGAAAGGLRRTAERLDVEAPAAIAPPPQSSQRSVFERAGWDHAYVRGQPVEVGRVVLEYLVAEGD